MDPLNNTTEYEYASGDCGCGGTGKLAKVTDALNNETTFDYDLAGNMILTTDALNRSTAYEYDALGRLTAIESPAGSYMNIAGSRNSLIYYSPGTRSESNSVRNGAAYNPTWQSPFANFFYEEDYGIYLSLLAEWCALWQVDIQVYCLMPNHVSFVAVPETANGQLCLSGLH